MIELTLVAAMCPNNGIGFQNKLPWMKNQTDMKFFKNLTISKKRTRDDGGMDIKHNVIIMGRKTWESMDKQILPDRWNIILSRKIEDCPNFPLYSICSSLENALIQINVYKNMIGDVFVIGGEELYRQAINLPETKTLFMTHFKKKYEVDTFFPPITQKEYRIQEQIMQTKEFEIIKYQRLPTEIDGGYVGSECVGEDAYLNILGNILLKGNSRSDRTNIGTVSLFGQRIVIDLTGGQLPLLTTKRTYWKGIVEELLWFLRGDTNVQHLQEKNVHIWDGNSSREFLDSVGLTDRAEGNIGPTYGFNFRHFGAEYTNGQADYTGRGVDQIQEALRLLREDPYSRRIIISLWNPAVQHLMALPPCLYNYQFYVHDGKLSCSTYQRSGDMGLGVPFNLASASLLTNILAKLSGLVPDQLIHQIGDAHIYNNHISALKEQCLRSPRPFPLLKINPDKNFQKVEDFEFEDFQLIGYYPMSTIKMDMAV